MNKGKQLSKGASKAPVNTNYLFKASAPTTTTSSNGIRVRHRELFSSVTSTGTNCIWCWTIQPGYGAMFPWLSNLAAQFELYRCLHLSVEFIPRCNTSTDGQIVFAIDQDADDSLPPESELGRMSLMNNQNAISGSIWNRLVCNYPGKLLVKQEKYVRADGEIVTVEPRTADLGILFVGLFGTPPGTTLGDLVVSYEFEFRLPQMRTLNTLTAAPNMTMSVGPTSGSYSSSAINPLVPYPVATEMQNINASLIGSAANMFRYYHNMLLDVQDRGAFRFIGKRPTKARITYQAPFDKNPITPTTGAYADLRAYPPESCVPEFVESVAALVLPANNTHNPVLNWVMDTVLRPNYKYAINLDWIGGTPNFFYDGLLAIRDLNPTALLSSDHIPQGNRPGDASAFYRLDCTSKEFYSKFSQAERMKFRGQGKTSLTFKVVESPDLEACSTSSPKCSCSTIEFRP